MMHEYTKSKEEYKGFVLEIRMLRLTDHGKYQKRCHVFKAGKSISICNTKKEAKDLIDQGYIDMFPH